MSKHSRVRFAALLAPICLVSFPNVPAFAVVAQVEGTSVDVPAGALFGKRSPAVAEAQVLLDQARFSPGVIDGYGGGNTRRAIEAYQRANGLSVTGTVDPALLDKLRAGAGASASAFLTRYTITEADVAGPFVVVPSGMEAMSKLDRLAYETPVEALAERFHMARAFLTALNPQADFGKAGTQIIVAAAESGELGVAVARIEVDGAASVLRAFDGGGKLLATYPATVGSSQFPSPTGQMTVRALAADPKYYFSPAGRDWGPDRNLTIAAGPNNPVGSTWIDLSKDGYGIHGTPDPRLIGKTASHGCVRLTNWDARVLGQAVKPGTVVEFV